MLLPSGSVAPASSTGSRAPPAVSTGRFATPIRPLDEAEAASPRLCGETPFSPASPSSEGDEPLPEQCQPMSPVRSRPAKPPGCRGTYPSVRAPRTNARSIASHTGSVDNRRIPPDHFRGREAGMRPPWRKRTQLKAKPPEGPPTDDHVIWQPAAHLAMVLNPSTWLRRKSERFEFDGTEVMLASQTYEVRIPPAFGTAPYGTRYIALPLGLLRKEMEDEPLTVSAQDGEPVFLLTKAETTAAMIALLEAVATALTERPLDARTKAHLKAIVDEKDASKLAAKTFDGPAGIGPSHDFAGSFSFRILLQDFSRSRWLAVWVPYRPEELRSFTIRSSSRVAAIGRATFSGSLGMPLITGGAEEYAFEVIAPPEGAFGARPQIVGLPDTGGVHVTMRATDRSVHITVRGTNRAAALVLRTRLLPDADTRKLVFGVASITAVVFLGGLVLRALGLHASPTLSSILISLLVLPIAKFALHLSRLPTVSRRLARPEIIVAWVAAVLCSLAVASLQIQFPPLNWRGLGWRTLSWIAALGIALCAWLLTLARLR